MNALAPVLASTDFMSKLLPAPLDFTSDDHASRDSMLLLLAPSSPGTPLDVHIDHCQRRCVTLYDSQRVVQFGH